ncbi:hypothetical protein BH23VER1_BH23VER1_09910 [soil metagenome]
MNEPESTTPTTPTTPSPPPVPHSPPGPVPRAPGVPLPANPGLIVTFETLLKRPMTVLAALDRGPDRGTIVRHLVVTTVVCLAVFGIILGTHSMGVQLWAAPLKITIGLLASGLICLPSLYIFSCLSGLDARVSAVTGTLFASLCLMSLLLLGFAPVVLVFSQSTHSVAFLGALALGLWAIATLIGLRLVSNSASALGARSRSHLALWSAIFLLVALQMSTALRPIIGKSESLLTTERKFFLTHWIDQLDQLAPHQSADAAER